MFCDADDRLVLEAAECLYERAKSCDADVVEYRMQKVREDRYLQASSEPLFHLLKTVLDMQLTRESVRTIHEVLKKYLH